MRVGFIGLGVMGTPMALRLARAFPLTVWNRSTSKYPPLVAAGATVAATPAEAAAQSDIIFVMLFDEVAIEAILDKDDNAFECALRGKTLINTSSVSVAFSRQLAARVQRAGGAFVEMPVSGSRAPAEAGQLVGMVAGVGADVAARRVQPAVAPLVREAVYCGPAVGAGLMTKYAANTYAIAITVGLAEAAGLARAQGLDPAATLGRVLAAGPMASPYAAHKLALLVAGDWTPPQAAVGDCRNSARLIRQAGRDAHAPMPLMRVCEGLYEDAMRAGLAGEDMIAVAKVLTEEPGPDGQQRDLV